MLRDIVAAAGSMGGEAKRLEVARAYLVGANFLVLDESTNHPGIECREAHEEGLADFGGTIPLVSLDRWFLENVAERIILLEHRKLVAYEGGFSEFWRDAGPTSSSSRTAAGRSFARGGGTESRPEDRWADLGRRRQESADLAGQGMGARGAGRPGGAEKTRTGGSLGTSVNRKGFLQGQSPRGGRAGPHQGCAVPATELGGWVEGPIRRGHALCRPRGKRARLWAGSA